MPNLYVCEKPEFSTEELSFQRKLSQGTCDKACILTGKVARYSWPCKVIYGVYAQQLKLELLFKNAKGSSFENIIWADKFLVDILFVRDTLIAVFPSEQWMSRKNPECKLRFPQICTHLWTRFLYISSLIWSLGRMFLLCQK